MKIRLIIALFIINNNLFAQEFGSRWAVTATFFDQRYFINIREDQTKENIFHGMIRPGFTVGVERNWSQKDKKNRWFQGFEMQGFKYKYVDFGGTFLTEFGYERRFFNRFLIGSRLGLGGQLAWKDDQYQLYEDNEWKTYKDFGKANYRTVIQLRGNIGWKINTKFDAVIGYRYQITTPFYKPAEIGLMLSKAVEIGVRRRF
jgi:hypothetical protein